MNISYPSFIIKVINFLYELIFHEKMGDGVKIFLKDLFYITIGTLTATVLSFIFNIFSGRMLGPNEYGKFALIQSVAMLLYIPMLFGFNTAMVKYSSEKEKLDRQSKIISTSYILVSLFTAISVIIFLIFSPLLLNLFSISSDYLYFALIFAILFVFDTITTETLRGLHKMKIYAIFQPISAIILLSSLLFFIFIKNIFSFKSLLYSVFLSQGIVIAILLIFFLGKQLKLVFDKHWAFTLTKYSLFAVIGGLSYALYTNIDKILINRYMGVSDVGIYRAYYMGSISLGVLFSGIFNTVFFPMASKYENKRAIFQKINKLISCLIILGIPFIFICEFIILKLYGSRYPFEPGLSFLFALATIIAVANGLYVWLMASVGKKGIKVTALSELISAGINVGLNIILIPRIGISGAVIATAISYLVFLCLVLSKRRLILIAEK